MKTAAEKAYVGYREYQEQIKALEKAQLGAAWLTTAKYSLGQSILAPMANGLEISPSDLF